MKEKKQINLEIGQNVKQIREAAGLTQEQLAEILGLGEKHISAIECGAAGVSLPTLTRLCTSLCVSADRVLFGARETDSRRTAAMQMMEERLAHLPERQFFAVKDAMDALLSAMEIRPDQE